jgi:transposase, IS5 family
MKPKKQENGPSAFDLFRSRLDGQINMDHSLVKLSKAIDWPGLDAHFGQFYEDKKGRPAIPTRLMAGLHYLKHAYDESDESVVERFLENPYWQYFCGFTHFQKKFPIDPSSMTRWRKRVGDEGIEKLLAETIETAKRGNLVKEQTAERVIFDTTVQEKAVAFPTDARLYQKARIRLVKLAKERGIELRQSFERLGKTALLMQGRHAHAKQFKRAKKETKKLKIFLGRVIRDFKRKCPNPDAYLSNLLALAEKIQTQKRNDKNKLYALHAPEVECIAKGKAHKRYEFGVKTAIATTSTGNWVVGIEALHGNPFDGHTLNDAIAQVKRITGIIPKHAYCDLGYKGADKDIASNTTVHIGMKKKNKTSDSERKWLKRRAAIEPVIGHLKEDHRLGRNFLKGPTGDKINALLAGCGFNFRKLMKAFLRLIQNWLFSLLGATGHDLQRLQSPS